MRNSLLTLAGALMLLGCASTPPMRTARTPVTPEVIYHQVQTNAASIRTFSGSGTLAVETPTFAQTASFTVSIRRPDSILVNLQGPFGLAVGTALLTRDEFSFYNSLRNELITGEMNGENLARVIPISLTFDDVVNFFTGGSFPAEDVSRIEPVPGRENEIVLAFRSSQGERRYWVDPASLLIARIEHFDREGRLVVEQRYSGFRTSAGVSLPSTIRLSQHRERRMVSLRYSSLAINTEPVAFVMNVPPNARHIRLQ